MADIQKLVQDIQQKSGCRLLPPLGLPIVCQQHILPDDVKQFYRLCGGAILYDDTTVPLTILPPNQIVLANSTMLIGLDEEDIEYSKERYGITWSWYLAVDYGDGNYITIDFDAERLGRCYDAHHEGYPGHTAVVATSFAELLEHLLEQDWSDTDYPGWKKLESPFG